MSVIFRNMVYGGFGFVATPNVTPGIYSVTSGTKAPVFGTGPGPYPPSGWTGIMNISVDDGFTIVPYPSFTFYHSGKATSNVYVSTNSYLTYGSGSNNFNGLSASNPALPKYFFGSADNSYQRVSYIAYGTDYVRIRYEGTAGTSGTVGNPNIVYEVTHFNPSTFGGNNVIEILVGKHSRTGGLFGAANATTFSVSSSIAANQSYVFVGSATGNNHVLYTGSHVAGTNY